MAIPLNALIASPRRLVTAIVLFVALDLTVLLINLWLTNQLAQDAVAINLAGRQRMLSQQTTKALLLATRLEDSDSAAAATRELSASFSLFEQTLTAFAVGGDTRGGDDGPVTLPPVRGDGAEAIAKAQALIAPVSALLADLRSTGTLSPTQGKTAAAYMVQYNRDILALMNHLTSALERDSVRRAGELRAIQSGAFVLAMVNFLVIVFGLLKRYRHVEEDGQRWRELARHDGLTGLANRKAFEESAGAILQRSTIDTEPGAVLMIDLDGFKPINDRFGHSAGDRLLIAFADQLRNTARATDVVARMGGDEFAMLCPQLHSRDHVAQFCDRIIAAISRIPPTDFPNAKVGASIGIALFPNHGQDLDTLLAAADRAMYAVKRSGGGGWQIANLYDATLPR